MLLLFFWTLFPIHLWEDDLVIRISDFHVHPNLRAGMWILNYERKVQKPPSKNVWILFSVGFFSPWWCKSICSWVIKLDLWHKPSMLVLSLEGSFCITIIPYTYSYIYSSFWSTNLIVASDHCFVRYFFYEAFSLSLTNVEIKTWNISIEFNRFW